MTMSYYTILRWITISFGILIFSAIALHLLSQSIHISTMNDFAIYLIVIVALVIGIKIYIGLQDITNMIFHHDTLDIEAQRTTIDTDNGVNIINPQHSLETQVISTSTSNALETQIIPTDLPPSYSEYAPPSYTFC